MSHRITLGMMTAVVLLSVFTWSWAAEQLNGSPNDNERIWLRGELRPVDEAEPDGKAGPVAVVKAMTRLGEPVDITATMEGMTVRVRSTLDGSPDGGLRGRWELQAFEPIQMPQDGNGVPTSISQVTTLTSMAMGDAMELGRAHGPGGGWKWIVQVSSSEPGAQRLDAG